MAKKADERLGFGKKDLQIMLILFAIAFLVRYNFKAAGLFHTDSVIEARAAEATLETGRLQYLQGNIGYPGEAILNTIVYAVFKLFGATSAEYSTLFSGILFGALCVPMMYALAKKLFNSEYVGVYSGAILTFFPVQLSLSTFGKGHGMELFFLMLSAYTVILAGEERSFRLKLAAVALLGFTMAIRQTSALLFPAFILLYWWRNPPIEIRKVKDQLKLKRLQKLQETAADLAILTVPALIVFAAFFLPKMAYEPSYNLAKELMSVGEETNVGFSLISPMLATSIAWATISVTPLGWLLAAVGLACAFREDRLKATALTLWFLAFFLYLGNIMSSSPRFVIPALAVPVMLTADGLDRIRQKFGKTPTVAVTIVLVAWMMYNILPVLVERADYCGPCEFSRAIGNITEPDAVIMAMDESQHYEYYAKRKTIGHPSGNDLLSAAKVDESLDFVEGLLRNGTPVYVTSQGLGYDIPIGYFVQSDGGRIFNKQTRRIYDNLRYDENEGKIYDTATNKQVWVRDMTGSLNIYGLELANRFIVYPVAVMKDEDWHHSCVESARYDAILFNITLRDKNG